tara:strand:+ start:138 stop:1457 length:1320 start_codon:yes stop_codon:yes gene_type:complete
MGSKSQPQQTTGTETVQKLSSPSLEAALALYTPELMGMLSGNIQTDTFAPRVAAQNQLQQAAITSALKGQGFDYDPGSGAVTGTGIGAYQPFLDAAGTAAGQIQGAGAGALGQAQSALNQQQALAQSLSASGAASPFMQKASGAADAAQLAALAGQGAGTADFQAARALTGPQAYEQFMSPYQQEVIDTTRQELERQLQQQQAQLGASAGSAFGGGRFGVAQGELAAGGARGIAQTLAGLRQQGFAGAQAAAAQAQQQRMGLGQAAMGQALQNQQLLQSAGQQQAGLGSQAAALATGDMQALGQVAQSQGALAQSQMSPYQQALSANMAVAQAIPQFSAQQFGILSSFGDQQQKYQQAGLDAISQRNKLAQYAPYEQMGFVGSQLAGLIGGYPGGTSIGTTTAPGPTATQQALGAGLVGTGIMANLGGIFGYGNPAAGG